MMRFRNGVVCAIVANFIDCIEATSCDSVIFSGGTSTNAAEIRGTYTKGPYVGGQPSYINGENGLYLSYYVPHSMWHIHTQPNSAQMTALCNNCHTTADLLTTTWKVFTTGDKANPGSPQVDNDMKVECIEPTPCDSVTFSAGTSTNAAEIWGTYSKGPYVGGQPSFINREKGLYLSYYVPHNMWHIHTQPNSAQMTALCNNCHTTADLLTTTWSVFTTGDKANPGDPQVDSDMKVECSEPTPCESVIISGGTSTNAAEIRGMYMKQSAYVGGQPSFMNDENDLYLFYYVPHNMWHIHTQPNSAQMTAKCNNCHSTADFLNATWGVFTTGDKAHPGSPQDDTDISVECVVPTPAPTPTPTPAPTCPKDTGAQCGAWGVCFQRARGNSSCDADKNTCVCNDPLDCVYPVSMPLSRTWYVCARDQESAQQDVTSWMKSLALDVYDAYFGAPPDVPRPTDPNATEGNLLSFSSSISPWLFAIACCVALMHGTSVSCS